jgi:transposase
MSGRVEIITRPERRRRWSDEEKLRLVAEACRPGNSVSRVAHEHGVSASQLFGWRRQALAKGLVTDQRCERGAAPALTFAPVEVADESPRPDPVNQARAVRQQMATRAAGAIEIELKGGDRVRVEGRADAGTIVRILAALRRA